MIKQTWEISPDEFKRILSLHESATKNNYLFTEQMTVTKKLEPKTFEIPPQSFKSGFYSAASLTPDQKQGITNTLNQIATYLKEKKGIPMSIQIVAGESTPPNYDREKNRSLNTGDLSRLRGETMKKILIDFFQNLVKSGELPSMPKIPTPQTNVQLKMPREPYGEGDDAKDPKYEKDQFVKFTVIASGEEKTACLVDLKIIFVYIHQQKEGWPCRGVHTCDGAIFNVYLNKVKVGVVNLNNGQEKNNNFDRKSEIIVTADKVNEIVNTEEFKKNKELILWTSCGTDPNTKCHSEAPEVYIYNKNNEMLFPTAKDSNACLAPGSGKGLTRGPWSLLVLDGCGKVKYRTSPASTESVNQMYQGATKEEEARIEKDKKEKEQKEIERKEKEIKDKQEYDKQQALYIEELKKLSKTEGLLLLGKNATDFFGNDKFQIISQSDQGDFYLLKIKNLSTKANRRIYSVWDPNRKSLVNFDLEPNGEILVKYKKTKLQIPMRKNRYLKDVWVKPIDQEGKYYFSSSDVPVNKPNQPYAVVKGTAGNVLELEFD